MVSWYTGTASDLQGNLADVYLIAFERRNVDDDFQDGVYELRIARAVPEPATYTAVLMFLAWTALRRSRID